MRAIIVVTAGDIALTLGVLFAWIKFGVFSSLLEAPAGQSFADPFSFSIVQQGVIATLHHGVASTGPRALLVMGIVFLVAAAVRSALFPFTVWLTDTAASAVPVIALVAATVAPLGIYLVARIYPVVAHAPRTLPVLALAGGITVVLSAATGIAQRSITRIAVCAVSAEIGLGIVAVGMGGYSAGLFIAITSMFTSTLLLLAVGNLVRVYRTDDIAEMGGAWAKLRTTSVALGVWTVLAGGLGFSAYYAMASALSGTDPAGGTFSGTERIVVLIVTVIGAVLVALLAGRVLLTVTGGTVARRRGFQHDRVTEVEGTLRRVLWLAILAAVVVAVIGLPGLEPFMRFVFDGRHHQAIGLDGTSAVFALLTLVCGLGAAYLWFGPARRAAAMTERALLPLRVAAEGFYVERFTELAAEPILAIAARVAAFDDEVTAPIETSVGESVDYAAAGLAFFRNARFARYLAGGIVVIAILALLSVLAATGHLWVHLA